MKENTKTVSVKQAQNSGSLVSVLISMVRLIPNHFINYAFVYTIGCYLFFVFVNLRWLKISGDPYGTAMVFIGFFWLFVVMVCKRLKSILDI